MNLWEKAQEIAKTMQCNCDLDNWQPEPDTGHSCVCRIRKAALAARSNCTPVRTGLIEQMPREGQIFTVEEFERHNFERF